MSSQAKEVDASSAPVHQLSTRPAGAPEFSVRAVIAAMIVAAVIGGSYPYVVMKLGFGPNISVVSAFFGYLALGIIFKSYNRWENNIVQTAGTSAGQTAFMCVLMAAFDMLKMDPKLGFHVSLTPMQSFMWLTTAGCLGVLLAIPMRQHFIVDQKLTFADGVAAAETLVVLDSRDAAAKSSARSMGISTLLSGLLMVFREDARVIADRVSLYVPPAKDFIDSVRAFVHRFAVEPFYRIPAELTLPPGNKISTKMDVGISWSLLSLGSGMIVGMRINASMLLGAILSWVIAPRLLVSHHVIAEYVRKDVLLWVMWPATGMLVAGGLTALFLRWDLLVKTFKELSLGSKKQKAAKIGGGLMAQWRASEEFPASWVIWGTLFFAVALIIVQRVSLDMPIWMTIVAILLSIPLMLVGLRVMGETNWGPISAMSNMMQAVFGVLAPGHVAANMTASGVTGSIATESEGLMQDFKTGDLIGSSPKYLTITQLLAIPIGAAAVAYVYPLLRNTYGFASDDNPNGLSSPISTKWAGFAKLLSQGLSALPSGAIAALIVAVLLGVLFTVLESTSIKKWVPSPTGIGIGMLVPASAIITMFIGGLVEWVWTRFFRKNSERHLVPVASGFIAGEAIVAVVLPILVAIGLLKLAD